MILQGMVTPVAEHFAPPEAADARVMNGVRKCGLWRGSRFC
jgi:hypothetical protein